MSFDWVNYLHLARQLAADAADEARQRSAISRAYYAAFHCACNYVQSQSPGELTRRGEDHHRVWSYLSRAPRRQEKAAGRSGYSLCRARKAADYEGHGLRFPMDTKEALANAEAILRSLGAGRDPLTPASEPSQRGP